MPTGRGTVAAVLTFNASRNLPLPKHRHWIGKDVRACRRPRCLRPPLTFTAGLRPHWP